MQEGRRSSTSLHSSFENEAGLTLTSSLLAAAAAGGGGDAQSLLPTTPTSLMMTNFAGNLTGNLASDLSNPAVMAAAAAVVNGGGAAAQSTVPGVSEQTINNIASSLQNLNEQRTSSRNSYR